MRVVVWPGDNGGVGHYRLRFPAQTLADQGCDVRILPRLPKLYWDREWYGQNPPLDARVLGFAEPLDADILIVQRPTWLLAVDVVYHAKQAGVKVVVDVDDRLDRVHKRHVVHDDFVRDFAHHEYLDVACKLADLVTVSTPALADRYGHGHSAILPNLVPARYLNLAGLKRPGTVGWSGYVGTHPGDLQTTGGAVQTVLHDGWTFHVVGPPDGVRQALQLRTEPSATGTVSFEEYPLALAELEVGVVPLEPSEFNQAKSCLKMMEMAAVGVPVIGSPTPDNLRLHKMGVGLIADSRGQWRRHLGRLTRDIDLRYEMAEKGRDVMSGLTYELQCGRWWEAWASTIREKVAA